LQLGVSKEEHDYPEPKHQSKQRRSSSSLDTHRSLASLGRIDTDRADRLTQHSEIQMQVVPVGASFQKFLKKRSDIDFLDMEFHDKARFNQLNTVVASDTKPKQITVTHSLPNALSSRMSSISRQGAASVSQTISKRHDMLATRELYQSHQYSRATTPARGMKPERGQVRNFQFQGIGISSNEYQDIEDMLADELSEKVIQQYLIYLISPSLL